MNRNRGYPHYPTIRVPVNPDNAKVIAPPKVYAHDPGDYFSDQIKIDPALSVGRVWNIPDIMYWFRSDQLYNCLEIDADFYSLDDGWVVPEYCTLYLSETIPSYNVFSLISNQRGEIGGNPNTDIPGVFQWDWERNVDFRYNAGMLRAQTAGPYPGLYISVSLPNRKVFQLHGTKLFRFALMAMWMYRKPPAPHNTQAVPYNPTWQYRVWFDEKQTYLKSVQ